MSSSIHREGELYKVYTFDHHTFEIRYGYYDPKERGRVEPLPVYPDLHEKPHFNLEGFPIVTMIQPPCKHYKPADSSRPEFWCGDCRYYAGGHDEISLCNCRHRKRCSDKDR